MFRYMCVHKNLFSCKVLTVQTYIKFCAVIASLYWWCFKYLSFCVYSYCDANIRYSNSYRRYNKDIPQFLRNKSPDFVKHCLLKIYLAENIDLSRIVNTGGGNFTVVSFSSNSKQRYELCFGNTSSMPKCSCNDWGRTGYLCKHFFAIFKKYPAWTWKDLSKLFTESPFLNLDLQVIPIINFDSDDRNRNKIEAPVLLSTLTKRYKAMSKMRMISLTLSCPVNASGEPAKPHF